jgi:hypothetical protein
MLVLVSVANAAHGLVRVPAGGWPTNAGEHVSGVNYRRTDAYQFTTGEGINTRMANKEKGGRVST